MLLSIRDAINRQAKRIRLHFYQTGFICILFMKKERTAQLVTAVMEDDELAFKELFDYYFPGLYSFSNSMLANAPLAEEVVADVFIKLWENRKMLHSIKNLSAYLYTATRHASLNYIRLHKPKHHISVDELENNFSYGFETPETTAISKENLARITTVINQLPPRCKLIFHLVKEEKLRYREIAQMLNISQKTVEAQMAIAMKRIAAEAGEFLSSYAQLYNAKKSS